MRTETAQAFLVLLTQISVKSSAPKVLTAYGNFFRAQVANGSESFLDHVLDQVLIGRDNPLAGVCAKGAREPKPVELAAVKSDLEMLQRLCVQESTISRWCVEMAAAGSPARTQPDAWRAAAADLGAPRSNEEEGEERTNDAGEGAVNAAWKEKGASEQERVDAGRGFEGEDDDADESDDSNIAESATAAGSIMRAPASGATRRAAREVISQSWAWSEALPTLTRYWRDHGVDEVQSHSVLDWQGPKGGLRGRPELEGELGFETEEDGATAMGQAWSAKPLPGTVEVHSAVAHNLATFAAGGTPRHVLVHGPPGAGKRWLLKSAAGASFPAGLRVVRVPRGELRTLPELLAVLRSHPRVRFAVLLDMPLSLTPFAEFHNELVSALDGGGGGVWPANAQLCATALRPSACKPGTDDDGGSLAVRFGLSLELKGEKQ